MHGRLEQLDAARQADIRGLIGWTVAVEDLPTLGETVADRWLVLGQRIQDEDRLRVQRNWLLGVHSKRSALVLQFSAAGQPFPESFVAGTQMEGDLVF